MKLIKWLIILGALGYGSAWFYGRSQPREHTVVSTVVMVAPADQVWKAVRDIQATPEWWSDMKSARRIAGRGRESWEQNMGAAGLINLEVTRETPGRQLVMTILNTEDQGWGGKWTYDVVPTASGTEVTLTEEGFVNPPIGRALMKLRGRYRTVDSYLRSLGAKFGESVTPRHG